MPERAEPVVDWENVGVASPRSPRDGGPRRGLIPWKWALGALVLLSLLGWLVHRPLVDCFWPDSQVQALLDQAQQALDQGRLSSGDGRGARQLYEAALALDNDRGEARAGLQRVGEQAIAQAEHALQRNEMQHAEALLALARELQVPRTRTDALAERLRHRQTGDGDLEQWLRRARQAQEQGRLDGGPETALPLYQRVLAVDPADADALEGREDALADLLQPVPGLLQQRQLAEAAALIERARGYDPGYVELPAMTAQLSQAVERRRDEGLQHLREGRLAAAAAALRAVLQLAPEDMRAQQGLEQLASAYGRQAIRDAEDYRFDAARTAVEQARLLDPGSAAVARAEQEIARNQQLQGQVPAKATGAARRRQLEALLADMERAEAAGQWLSPPGDSAYDKLRAAQSLAPQDPQVQAASLRLVAGLQACFERELGQNRIARADACLQAWWAVSPRTADASQARTRLAQKWVAVGNERLGADDLAFASRALAEARKLDARAPGVVEFGERVRIAQAARN